MYIEWQLSRYLFFDASPALYLQTRFLRILGPIFLERNTFSLFPGVTSLFWWSESEATPGTWRPGPPSAALCSPGRRYSPGWGPASSSTRTMPSSRSFVIILKLNVYQENGFSIYNLLQNYCNYAFYYLFAVILNEQTAIIKSWTS